MGTPFTVSVRSSYTPDRWSVGAAVKPPAVLISQARTRAVSAGSVVAQLLSGTVPVPTRGCGAVWDHTCIRAATVPAEASKA